MGWALRRGVHEGRHLRAVRRLSSDRFALCKDRPVRRWLLGHACEFTHKALFTEVGGSCSRLASHFPGGVHSPESQTLQEESGRPEPLQHVAQGEQQEGPTLRPLAGFLVGASEVWHHWPESLLEHLSEDAAARRSASAELLL